MVARLRAVVFDYDGVLADTEPLHLQAFQGSLGPRGVDLGRDDYFARYLGLDDRGVFEAIAADRGLGWSAGTIESLVADKTSRFRGFLRSGRAVLYPGVAERVREWGGTILLGIASGSIREEIEPVLESAGLRSLFGVIVAAGETERGKPAPDPYLRAVSLIAGQQAGECPIDPGSCLAVEDSPWGIDAAHGAGLPVVALTTSYPASQLGAADLVAERFDDLSLDLLDRVVCLSPRARR